MRVAIFDFDGTLYSSETFKLLMEHLQTHPVHYKKYKPFFRAILPLYIGYKCKIVSERVMKERSMQIYLRSIGTLSKQELSAFFDEMQKKIEAGFNKDVLARLQSHLDNQVRVLLVSGAYTPFLHAVTKGLSFDQIIGTDIHFNGDQIDLQTPFFHVQGTGKTDKIKESLNGSAIDWANSYAYGDSFSDLPVLELVGNPVAVKPDKRLHTVALKQNWEIIS